EVNSCATGSLFHQHRFQPFRAARVDNGIDSRLLAQAGVHHQVIDVALGPIDVEVLLDEGCALAVGGIDDLFRMGLTGAVLANALNLEVTRSVKEHMKGVVPSSQVIGSAASDN